MSNEHHLNKMENSKISPDNSSFSLRLNAESTLDTLDSFLLSVLVLLLFHYSCMGSLVFMSLRSHLSYLSHDSAVLLSRERSTQTNATATITGEIEATSSKRA